jgi:putative ABC transport system permease protein
MAREFSIGVAVVKAVRSWLATPRLTFAIVACIAVSIGGASTVLTFVYSLLLRPLPFPEASRLVLLEPRGYVLNQASRPYFSYPDFADMRRAASSFETLDGATVSRLVVVTGNGAERLRGEVITPGYVKLFGLQPLRGRSFTADEFEGRGERALMISSRLWKSHFASREDLVGQPVQTRSGAAVLIGVMPEGFLGVAEDEGTDYWLAERQNNAPAMLNDRTQATTLVFGRLRDGVTQSTAEGEVNALMGRLTAARAEPNAIRGVVIEPFGERFRAGLRGGLTVMLVASFFLLAIGCGNVAILLLARLVTRERELAVRLSIGAGRRDLVSLMWIEGSVLALAGGAAGLLLSIWLGDIFQKAAGLALPAHLPVVFGAAPLALCVVVVLLTGAVFTLLPAMVASRLDPVAALRSGARGIASGALQGRGGRLLVIGQTALAVALLAGAALFLRSYEKLRFVDLGFRSDNLLRYQVSRPREGYPNPEALAAFYRNLEEDLRAIPGVKRSGYMGPTLPPFDAHEETVRLKGEDLGTPSGTLAINQHFAANDVFEILGVPLQEGRWFGAEDRFGGASVGLVSRTLANRIDPKGQAIGRTLVMENGQEIRIVGIVKDARWNGQRNRRPNGLNLFLSLTQFPQASVGVLFEGTVAARSLIEPVRRAVLARDSAAALHWIDTMEEALDFQTVGERFWTILATAYAATALLLAFLGLYGVLTHAVAGRTREIGVRMALGATSGRVARMVALQGLRLVTWGLVAGLGFVLLSGGLIESRLHQTNPADPMVLGLLALILTATGALTSWLPARRASRISPLTALRSE